MIAFTLMLTAFIATSGASPASAATCDKGSAIVTGCPNVSGEVGGGGATLSGEGSNPGSPGGSGGGSGSSNGGGGNSGNAGNGGGSGSDGGGSSGGGQDIPRPCEEVVAGFCYGEGQPKPGDSGDSGDSDAGTPTVTISDVAHFRPEPPQQRMQPDGWMVVGLPANIYARTSAHVVSGSLFGAPAEVRFTPYSWHWTYGDGRTARYSTPGATWQSLGLAEFDPTPTSHIYRASGTYVIDLDVSYSVAYRFAGGPWTPLTGTIVLQAPPLTATAGEAVTVLVDRNCTTAPRGPGC